MDRLFTLCYLPMCLLLLILMLHYGPGVADPHTRITAGFAGFIVVTVTLPVVREARLHALQLYEKAQAGQACAV